MIYLDWAATALPHTGLIEQAYTEAGTAFANPSAVHDAGKEARRLLEQARERCAAVLSVPPDTVYFTSGGSESNTIVLLSLLTRPNTGSIAISALEHPSVREQAAMLKHCGWKVLTIPADRNGIIHPAAVLDTIQEDTCMTAVMSVNNEIGSIQPIAEIKAALTAHTAGKRSIHFHTDAVQAVGKIPFDQLPLNTVDSASMSAHKIGGPRGIGLLYLKKPLNTFIRGGSQEHGIRPGTENVAGASALAACLEHTYYEYQKNEAAFKALSHQLISRLAALPGCTLIPESRSSDDSRFSPWIVQCSFSNMPAEVMVRSLSERGISISAGSACSSKKKDRPILSALQIPAAQAQNAVRISLGYATTQSDITECIAAIKTVLHTFAG